LESFFKQFGEIKNVRVAKHPSGDPKGFAFIDFAKVDAVDKAISATGQEFEGRKIRVSYSSPPKSFSSRDEN